ncbi:tetratricopeptide repeat protein [Methylomusa anaerophila]|uniref:Lipoprotein NlpI n=1 Tax=Methylomusa anaerophila TaxID=1930071 RepID=A0A348AEC3_9FIRM|nr:tetratricopeptide repeat protein [Methylomusa anaerophila]BBB89421.1 lipoprotein NlpI precursor [Methylomusa anaerophila]
MKKWFCSLLAALVLVGATVAYAAAGTTGTDDSQKMIDELTRAIAANPNNPALYAERGRAYRNNGENGLAMADFNRAIELSPEYVPAYVERGLAYYEDKEYDAAWRDYDSIIKLDPQYADAYFRRGACYYYKNEFEAAVGDLDQAIRLNSKHPGAYLVKGVCYQKLGRKQEAVNAYKALLANVPPAEKEAIALARKLLKSLGVEA